MDKNDEIEKIEFQKLTDWDSYIKSQKEICEKFGSKLNSVDKKLIIGCSEDLDKKPINGLRHPKEENSTGWFIWSGEYSEKGDFFKPVCAEHLIQRKPEIIKYLGLEVGFRFLVDKNGYEDVWFDKEIT